MDLPGNKTIFSGIQPSGTLHIGNYLGAIKQWVALQEGNNCTYCIVDEHAITVPYEAKDLPERVLNAAAMYLAAGVDPTKSIIFVQSHVSAHTELAWLLGTTTPLGELNRMTQYKDKARQLGGQAAKHVSLGLFSYPVLMAADILLYNADLVPVGEDQVQHIELTRAIAKRFNNKFGEVFTMPEAFVNTDTARIMSLTDPAKKMSKSDAEKSYIALTDDADEIKGKIASAVTETEPVFSFKESGPAVQNLLKIYQAFSEEQPEAIEQKFAGKGYKEFKEDLAKVIIEKLEPLQKKYHELRKDDDTLRMLLGRGKTQAQHIANETIHKVKSLMGLR